MKRIHFDNMKNKVWISMIVLSLVFIITGGFELIEFENPKINKIISVIGFFLQAIYYTRLFWHKNSVQWNDKVIMIRIKPFLGKPLQFDEIKATELDERILNLTKYNGEKITLDLSDFAESDIQKLNEIIVKNTIANNV